MIPGDEWSDVELEGSLLYGGTVEMLRTTFSTGTIGDVRRKMDADNETHRYECRWRAISRVMSAAIERDPSLGFDLRSWTPRTCNREAAPTRYPCPTCGQAMGDVTVSTDGDDCGLHQARQFIDGTILNVRQSPK